MTYPEDILKAARGADTQKIGEAMREAVRNVCKGPTLSDELTDEQYAALFRAALKAMEGE